MNTVNRPIFRTEAVDSYLQNQEQAVLPRFIAPRTFIYLWVLLAGLILSGGFSLLAPLPVYATGQAFVLAAGSADQTVQVVAFLPPEDLAHLEIGQKLFLGLDDKSERLSMPITAVGPRIISPEEARQLFDLNPAAAAMITQPVAVVMASWQPPAGGLAPTAYIGSAGQADVEVGTRRILSFLPMFEHVFPEPVPAEPGNPAGEQDAAAGGHTHGNSEETHP